MAAEEAEAKEAALPIASAATPPGTLTRCAPSALYRRGATCLPEQWLPKFIFLTLVTLGVLAMYCTGVFGLTASLPAKIPMALCSSVGNGVLIVHNLYPLLFKRRDAATSEPRSGAQRVLYSLSLFFSLAGNASLLTATGDVASKPIEGHQLSAALKYSVIAFASIAYFCESYLASLATHEFKTKFMYWYHTMRLLCYKPLPGTRQPRDVEAAYQAYFLPPLIRDIAATLHPRRLDTLLKDDKVKKMLSDGCYYDLYKYLVQNYLPCPIYHKFSKAVSELVGTSSAILYSLNGADILIDGVLNPVVVHFGGHLPTEAENYAAYISLKVVFNLLNIYAIGFGTIYGEEGALGALYHYPMRVLQEPSATHLFGGLLGLGFAVGCMGMGYLQAQMTGAALVIMLGSIISPILTNHSPLLQEKCYALVGKILTGLSSCLRCLMQRCMGAEEGEQYQLMEVAAPDRSALAERVVQLIPASVATTISAAAVAPETFTTTLGDAETGEDGREMVPPLPWWQQAAATIREFCERYSPTGG